MKAKAAEQFFWGIGLDEAQRAGLEACLGSKQRMRFFDEAALPVAADIEAECPVMLFASSGLNKRISASGGALGGTSGAGADVRHLKHLPRIAVLPEGYSQQDLETAVDSDALDILRPPFAAKTFNRKLRQAMESVMVHRDILCMSKEITLGRDLLERKNTLLDFLVNFLTDTATSHEAEEILQSAFKGMGLLLPAHSMHAAIWYTNAKGEQCSRFFVAAEQGSPAFAQWRQQLQAHGESCGLPLPAKIEEKSLKLSVRGALLEIIEPSVGNVVYLPLKSGENTIGFLAVVTNMKRGFGRDQAQVLDAILRHLALDLQNALGREVLRNLAEYDSLTGLYNRRYFEEALARENARGNRYKMPFSLLFIDVDHFKKINDTHGHQAGDQVLQQLAEIFRATLRNVDLCARFGGEEFVVLLPHTPVESAAILAERLRRKVNDHVFNTSAGPIRASISLGLAGSAVQAAPSHLALLALADKALYAAKNSGRNCLRVSGDHEALEECM